MLPCLTCTMHQHSSMSTAHSIFLAHGVSMCVCVCDANACRALTSLAILRRVQVVVDILATATRTVNHQMPASRLIRHLQCRRTRTRTRRDIRPSTCALRQATQEPACVYVWVHVCVWRHVYVPSLGTPWPPRAAGWPRTLHVAIHIHTHTGRPGQHIKDERSRTYRGYSFGTANNTSMRSVCCQRGSATPAPNSVHIQHTHLRTCLVVHGLGQLVECIVIDCRELSRAERVACPAAYRALLAALGQDLVNVLILQRCAHTSGDTTARLKRDEREGQQACKQIPWQYTPGSTETRQYTHAHDIVTLPMAVRCSPDSMQQPIALRQRQDASTRTHTDAHAHAHTPRTPEPPALQPPAHPQLASRALHGPAAC